MAELVLASILLTVAFSALPAQAQRAFYLDRVQFGGAPEDGLVTRRPYLSKETRVYGSTALAYVLNPLRDSTVAADEGVDGISRQKSRGRLLSRCQLPGRGMEGHAV